MYSVHTDGFEDDTINAEILGSQLFDEVTNVVGNGPQREEADDEFVFNKQIENDEDNDVIYYCKTDAS